jgi:DNA anti-recombination protein RmuC
MSTDRFTEILNYLSAISRDVGELRQEFRQFRDETNARFERIEQRLDRMEQRLEKIEREQRQTTRRLDRIESLALAAHADVDELQERVTALEGGQT